MSLLSLTPRPEPAGAQSPRATSRAPLAWLVVEVWLSPNASTGVTCCAPTHASLSSRCCMCSRLLLRICGLSRGAPTARFSSIVRLSSRRGGLGLLSLQFGLFPRCGLFTPVYRLALHFLGVTFSARRLELRACRLLRALRHSIVGRDSFRSFFHHACPSPPTPFRQPSNDFHPHGPRLGSGALSFFSLPC